MLQSRACHSRTAARSSSAQRRKGARRVINTRAIT
jgi:hypothetical protein